ncbi:nuclear polyadenylated RNA-binding protein 3-like [Olea europaea var. sylvestris]|nr:nuclear polyadenylated RNA-binding protein 3-like [Olea europaea var. sylvestris]
MEIVTSELGIRSSILIHSFKHHKILYFCYPFFLLKNKKKIRHSTVFLFQEFDTTLAMVQVNRGSPYSASEHEQSTDNLNQDQNADKYELETEIGQEQDTGMPKEESENEHLVDDQETNQEDGNDDDQETNQEDGYDHREEENSQEGFDEDHQEEVEEEKPPVSSTAILLTDEEVNQENNSEADSVEDEGAEDSRKRGRESCTEENEEQRAKKKKKKMTGKDKKKKINK